MAKIHDFNSMLEKSHSEDNDAFFDNVYRKRFFTNMVSVTRFPHDGPHQRGGIDAIVTLSSSEIIKIDEKLREKDYGDILLEYYSDTERGIPGWVCKELLCSHIAYGFRVSGRCFLLPVVQLQQAFELHGQNWFEKYPVCEAKNMGYTTSSVAVPADVLYKAIIQQYHY